MTEGLGTERVDQVAYWNGPVGERWARLQEALDGAFGALTEAALAAADPRPGECVLDVGCGTGATVLELARGVGPAGTVLGVDVSRPMLALAEKRLERAGVSQARVLLADASLPLPGGPFDLAFSRFGVMFFDDPVAAFTAIRSGLAGDGRLAFACWQAFAANPWFAIPAGSVLALLPEPPPPADPHAPGPLALADPDRVRQVLRDAGFADIGVAPAVAPVTLGPLAAATDLLSQVGPASRALAESSPDRRPLLIRALRDALSPYAGPDGIVRLDGAVWLVTAQPEGPLR